LGRRASGIQADLSKPGAAEHLFAVAQQIASVDIVVNNAGIIRRAKSVDYNDQDWMAVLQVNLNSLWKLCQAAGRSFLSRGSGGKIINVASLLAFQGGITVPAYAASKGAVINQSAGQRMGSARRERERDRAGLHAHRQHRRTATR
jgi:2-deoxy-D-gluconate 3-dehydrogenase